MFKQLLFGGPGGGSKQTDLGLAVFRAVIGLLLAFGHGRGKLPPDGLRRFADTLASLNKVARDLQDFTADLETSDALLPRLVKDEEYGREVADQSFVQSSASDTGAKVMASKLARRSKASV